MQYPSAIPDTPSEVSIVVPPVFGMCKNIGNPWPDRLSPIERRTSSARAFSASVYPRRARVAAASLASPDRPAIAIAALAAPSSAMAAAPAATRDRDGDGDGAKRERTSSSRRVLTPIASTSTTMASSASARGGEDAEMRRSRSLSVMAPRAEGGATRWARAEVKLRRPRRGGAKRLEIYWESIVDGERRAAKTNDEIVGERAPVAPRAERGEDVALEGAPRG